MPSKPSPRYRLKLRSLSFISAVDRPAQETATALLMKRASGELDLSSSARVIKTDDALGLVFAWAWTSTVDGEPYHDLQGDAIDDGDDMIKVAAEFMSGPRTTDLMHDERGDGQVVFAMPMTKEIAKAFGVETTTSGLMVAIKPSAEVFARFKSGELTGLSIGATGVREPLEKSAPVRKGARLTAPDDTGHSHLVEADLPSGHTGSGEMIVASGAGYSGYHCHPFARNDDGSITIGAAMGHTHTLEGAKPAAPPAPAPVTPPPADSEEAHTKAHAAWAVGQTPEAILCAAKLNPSRAWAQPILKAHAEALDGELEIRKVIDAADNAHAEFYRRVDALVETGVKKSTAVTEIMTSDEGSALYEIFGSRQRSEMQVRAKVLTKAHVARRDECRDELAEMVESFALAHNLDQPKAQKRLLEVSKHARELWEEISEANRAIAAAPAIIEQQMAKARRAEHEKRQAQAEEERLRAEREGETPAQRALRERIDKIAARDKIDIVKARAFAYQHDEIARELYGIVKSERHAAQR